MDIYLIRHGECYSAGPENYDTEKRTANPELTEKGYSQAEKLANRLGNINFDMIYSSDLLRATETASTLSKSANSKVIEDKNFREIDMGDIYLYSWNEYPDIYHEWVKHEEDIPYPNGENGNMVWERCKDSLYKILKNDFKRIAIIAHGGVIRSIVCGILNIPQEKRFYIGYPPENCSISIIKYENNHFYLHTFNDYSHL